MKRQGKNKQIEDRDFVLMTMFANAPIKYQDNYEELMTRINRRSRAFNKLIAEGIIDPLFLDIMDSSTTAHLFKKLYQEEYKSIKKQLLLEGINPNYYELFILMEAGSDQQKKLLDIEEVYNFYMDYSSDKFILDYKPFNYSNHYGLAYEKEVKIGHPNQVFNKQYIKHPYSLDIFYSIFDFDENKINALRRMEYAEAVREAITTLESEREKLLKLHRNEPRHLVLIGKEKQGILRLNDDGLEIAMNPRQKKLSLY